MVDLRQILFHVVYLRRVFGSTQSRESTEQALAMIENFLTILSTYRVSHQKMKGGKILFFDMGYLVSYLYFALNTNNGLQHSWLHLLILSFQQTVLLLRLIFMQIKLLLTPKNLRQIHESFYMLCILTPKPFRYFENAKFLHKKQMGPINVQAVSSQALF